MASDVDDLLSQEYFQLQKAIEDFDQRALTIKAWSVTFSAAGLGLAYSQHERIILLVAALSALTFWMVEALWKTNQQSHYGLIWQIEDHFSGKGETKPFAIAHSWSEQFHAGGGYGRMRRLMWWPHVMMPHVVIVVAGVLLFFVAPPGVRMHSPEGTIDVPVYIR
jgi:hypothetical protein